MTDSGNTPYAIKLANSSYSWYRTAAIRSRRMHRGSEIAILVLSAAVPLAAVVLPGAATLTALLGSSIVVIGGARAIFHWHENYLRFSHARELVEAERRKYHAAIGCYSSPSDRDANLILEVTRIEQEEMGRWLSLASPSKGDE